MFGWGEKKKKTGRNVEGSGRNLILGTIPAIFQNKKVKHNSFFSVKQLRFTYFRYMFRSRRPSPGEAFTATYIYL
jgi:hypothetical protein